MSQSDTPNNVSRRDFMRLGAYTTAAIAAPMLINTAARDMSHTPDAETYTDVLVIGSGFAGTFAALEARKQGLNVTMMDKGTVGWSGMSPWASDSRPFDPSIYDREEWHRNLAINTEYLYDRKWIDIFMDESLELFYTLMKMGAHETRPFERGSKVFRKALENKQVNIIERVMATDLIQDVNGAVCGAVGFTYDDSSQNMSSITVYAKAVILCTGAGGYKSPGFPIWGQTFDGDGMAYRAGSYITGKEFNDTHPTFANYPAASYDFWEFAQQIKGAYVMAGPPEPLDGGLTLDLAINASQGKVQRGGRPLGGGPKVADQSHYKGKGYLGIPGLHVEFGGPPPIREDDDRKSLGAIVGGSTAGMGVHKGEGVFNSDYTCAADGVPGLYAAGDALGSMMCGALYPGRGFSSYGSAIQGRRAATYAAAYAKSIGTPKVEKSSVDKLIKAIWAPLENKEGFSAEWGTQTLRNTMTPYHILYIREGRRLEGALSSIEYLRQHTMPKMIARDGHELRMTHELNNMLLNAEMKLRASLFRTESRGTHYREDYPARNDAEWHCWVKLKEEGGKMVLTKHPLPTAWKPSPSTAYREAYPRVFPGEDDFRNTQSNS
jgi:succinate dehydrogenase/fumarate reductase flavoprotein subunit